MDEDELRTRNKEYQAKYRDKHREEVQERNKKYRKEHPDAIKKSRDRWMKNNGLQFKYGLTPDLYDAYFEAQHGRCAICGKHQSEFERRLAVDHDHKTKIVRGLLCTKCNSLLGLADDSTEILQRAINYLKERSR